MTIRCCLIEFINTEMHFALILSGLYNLCVRVLRYHIVFFSHSLIDLREKYIFEAT